VPLTAIVLLALAVHGPLLLMQLPANSYDATTHIFFAAHYANHWFQPWNEKWFGGFAQTTYPPLTHQFIALLSHVTGLTLGYMFVQLAALLLIPVGVFRYAKLWVTERAASYAAIGSVFLGSIAMLVYQSGQLPTTTAAALTLNALPYFYEWSLEARWQALLKGVLLSVTGAAAHHVTFIFGAVLFALPVLWLALLDCRRTEGPVASESASSPITKYFAITARGILFGAVVGVLIGVVLLPYFLQLMHNPIKQVPIPHASRDNYILSPLSGMNFWIIPMGALILAIPYIFYKGWVERRLRPLLVGWYVTTLFGLGGTTPFSRFVLQRAFEVLTFERFTFWATLMALPFVGLMSVWLIDRWQRKGVVILAVAAVYSCAMAVAWTVFNPINTGQFKVDQVIAFLNRDEHAKFRYITLGFSNQFAKVSAFSKANSLDGDYHSARLLPEMTRYGAGQLYNSKYYGTAGMEALRAVLKHADQYGLRYIFVHDRYYEPLLAFAGWRQAESYDNGSITLWTKDNVPPAQHIDFGPVVPPQWQGVLWGLLPVSFSLMAILAVVLIPDRRRSLGGTLEFPSSKGDYAVEARR
jgi:hypothetical protein